MGLIPFLLTLCSPDLEASALNIAKPDWETYCHKVADMIIQEQSPARVMEVRTKLYELLSHCIPPSIVLKVCCAPFSFDSVVSLLTIPSLLHRVQTIADRVVEQVDEALKANIMHWAAIYVRPSRLSLNSSALAPRDSRPLE